VTPFEARASLIAASLAGHVVSIDCADPGTWRSLAAEYGFDQALTWALTPLDTETSTGSRVPRGYADFSPRACRFGDAFARRPTERGARICRHGTTRPVLGECDDWALELMAVHVLGHESMHLAGIIDEATADCLATQLAALVAGRFGASTTFARSLANEYWRFYYRSGDSQYRSPACRDGGRLDLFPKQDSWPTPSTYPANVAHRIDAFRAAHT